MKRNDRLRKALACACSAAIVAVLVGGLVFLELSLLDSKGQQLIGASGLANGWLYTLTIDEGEHHAHP